uniref:Carboxymethylenebutenolidase homolog n=1 Tax=Erpetoichthys calabaricus TaxID=27687 RepID=A0A8C4RUX0_ERPCA
MANEANPCPCDIGDRIEYGGLGKEIQIEHVQAYITKPSADTEKAVIVIQDIFGFQLPNTRYMVDILAVNGYTAICPDFYLGKEPWKPTNDWSQFEKVFNILFTLLFMQIREVDVVLKFLKDHCNAKRIAIIGFCWGGVATHHLILQYPELKAGVSHYGIVREGEGRYDLKSPTLFIFAEDDHFIPLDQVASLEENLKQKCPVDFIVKVYPGQTHGFAHRKREDINPQDKPFIEEARTDMINWLNKYV